MNGTSCLAFVLEHGAGNPDQRTARNVLETVIPNARAAARTPEQFAAINAAEEAAYAVINEADRAAVAARIQKEGLL